MLSAPGVVERGKRILCKLESDVGRRHSLQIEPERLLGIQE
jgi:hypothetical protein